MRLLQMNFLNTQSKVEVVKKIDLDKIQEGEVRQLHLHLIDNGLGLPVYLPVIVAKGFKPGPTLGFTAAVHGNELNGIKVIHKLMKEIRDDIKDLSGTIISVPVVNTIGVLNA